jgi:hypothetical protein
MNSDDDSFLDQDVAPTFDSWLSVGEAYRGNISYGNQNHDITLISYYDRISGFSSDPLANTIHWSMPFDWDHDRVQNQTIFVHEEVQVPKSFIKFLNSTSIFPAVNSVPLKASSIAVDPYSSEGNYIIHYLINKDSIIQIRDQQKPNFSKSDLMSFSLFINSRSSAQQTSADFMTTSGVRVHASWQPTSLTPNNNSTLTVQFFDVLSETAFTNASVIYDLVIADKNRMQIVNKVSLVAVNGTDSQTINFPANDTYKISISVTGIERQDRGLDQSRDGEATGIVVVPEFPDFLASVNNTGLILGAIISAMLLVTMKSRQQS